MPGRLRDETLERVLDYGERIMVLSNQLATDRRPNRLIDQIIGSGTSAGANVHEAHEAMSKADFVKCLSISVKELSETRYWLKLIQRMQYLPAHRLDALLDETSQLTAIFKTLIGRAKRKT